MRTMKQWWMPLLFVLVILPGAASGALIYDQATFIATLQPGYYLEDFSALVGPGEIMSPIAFSGGAFAYTASAPGGFYSVQTPGGSGNQVLSTLFADDAITLTFTSGNITAVGGFFLVTDILGDIATGTITLNFNDGTSVTLTNQTLSSFTGYLSPGLPITSLIITAPQPDGEGGESRWPTVDDLIVGAVAENGAPPDNGVIPEPSTLWLMAGGIVAVILGRRKTA